MVKTIIKTKQANELMKKYKINPEVISPKVWEYALNVELEHGSRYGKEYNVTHDNPDATARIVEAHLKEHYLYYKYLKEMEELLENTPNIDFKLK